MFRYSKWTWTSFILFLVVILAVFGAAMLLTNNSREAALEKQKTLQDELNLITGQRTMLAHQLDGVGTDSYIEDAARNEFGYVKPGEIKFRIENSDLLDNYTPEEWQIILDEMAWDGR